MTPQTRQHPTSVGHCASDLGGTFTPKSTPTERHPVLTIDPARRTNAAAIADCARLGYLRRDDVVIDATFGIAGGFWRDWLPATLIGGDADPRRARDVSLDFTALPFPDDCADVVVFDPPYKLNGTSAHASDDRYGVAGRYRGVEAVRVMYAAGIAEAMRVASRAVLIKTQDQVSGGRRRWLSHDVHRQVESLGGSVRDELHVFGFRRQPTGTNQRTAWQSTSVLVVAEVQR